MLLSYRRIECQGQCLRHPAYTHQARGGRVECVQLPRMVFSGNSKKHLQIYINVEF